MYIDIVNPYIKSLGSTDNMSSANEETPEQDATHEEEVRTATSEEVYPQRALTFLIILVFTFLVILLIIGLIGLKWINRIPNKCGYYHPSELL